MQIIVLIPCLICAFALFRYSVPHVFLRYFLPFFVLFPSYYYWKISALPPITVGQSALLPIGAAIVLTLMRRWRFTTSDIWIGLFLLSTCVTEYKAERTTAAIFNLYYGVCEGLIPYMIGKVLIEQSGIRAATARRIVTLMTICGIISLYEYRMSINPFTLVWGRFFQNESFAWKTQLRWGFGRVSGPYGQSELAGMVILFGIMLAVWVSYAKPWPEKFPWFPNHPLNVKTIIFILLAIFLFTTQARGPWLGCLFALPIAFIGKSKHIWRNCVLFFGITLPILGFTYVQVKQHLVNADPSSAEAQTAQYRALLFDNYKPTAIAGGPFGWGQAFRRVPGQESIDNEYLFIWLTQGWVGLASMCLLGVEALIRLFAAAAVTKDRMDRFFAFSLFGTYAGLLLTVGTVFLGNQPYELFFLIAGWSQVLNRVQPEQPKLEFHNVMA
ncbi:O-antigen ligase family protein [Granulicella cerasi]|uniref:O-antigen ligase family protein n=1 Tax=Granulicella cerasi TaxID=741063 RepID=UPI0021E08E66|nr:O-antigen ligase family protein [Granulicella cerasi]